MTEETSTKHLYYAGISIYITTLPVGSIVGRICCFVHAVWYNSAMFDSKPNSALFHIYTVMFSEVRAGPTVQKAPSLCIQYPTLPWPSGDSGYS